MRHWKSRSKFCSDEVRHRHSIAQFDQIAQIFSDPSRVSEPLRSMEADQFYRSAIQYYKQLVRMPYEDQLVSELRAKVCAPPWLFPHGAWRDSGP